MLADIQEIYLCKKCKKDFTEDEGVKSQAGAKVRLNCPACDSFCKFIPRPMPDPGLELCYSKGPYFRMTIGEVFEIAPSYVEYLAGTKGRVASAARMFLEAHHMVRRVG